MPVLFSGTGSDQGSPAKNAGIREGSLPVTVAGDQFLLGGDIITEMNGQSTQNLDQFAQMMNALKIGDSVQLTLYRNGQTRQVAFNLIERPPQPGDIRSSSSNTQLLMRRR